MSSRSDRKPSSKINRSLTRQRSCAKTANSVPRDLGMRQRRRISGPLGQRAVEADDVDLLAVVVAVEARVLKVEADLEHMLTQPVVLRERQRLDQLQAADVALLTVEEVAALPLRRVDHRQLALGLLIDLERARREGRLENGMRRQDQPIDQRQPRIRTA